MDANDAFNELRSHPGKFLKYYPVNTGGWSGMHLAAQPNLHQFRMYKRDPTGKGTAPSKKPAHFGATRPGLFGPREISSFVISHKLAPDGIKERLFSGLSVPMHTSNTVNVAALSHYVVNGMGDGLMVTGQLSGCTFAWLQVGTNLLCTHIKPNGIQGIALHNQLNMSGRFAAHPGIPLQTYGANDYGGGYANVIGVRSNGTWELYAQHSNDQFRTITAARRIQPGAIVPL
jgi:hypothetical protein